MTELLTSSRMAALLRCPRAHYWRYEVGLRADSDAAALRFGSAWHRAMESHAVGGDFMTAFNNGLGTANEIDEQQAAVLFGMLSGFYLAYPTDPDFATIYPEQEFRVPLERSRSFELAGKIDGLGQLKDGRLAILEHKTTSESIDSGSEYWLRLRFNAQLMQYVLAARALGWAVETVIYAVAKKPAIRPKQIPAVDADGFKIVTVDATGERALLKTGKPKQTAGEGETLQGRQETPEEFAQRLTLDCQERAEFYFARRELTILDSDLEEFAEQRRMIGISILNYRQAAKRFAGAHQAWPRNCTEMNCRCCEYASFCLNNVTPSVTEPPTGFSLVAPNEELNTEGTAV